MAAYGLGIIVAPIIGPTLGGWITDNYTWRWIFYLNIPVGIFSLMMMARYVHDPPYIHRQRDANVDLWGIGLLALGLGSLQILLDTGQRKDWLGSREIRIEAFCCIVGLLFFVIRELTVDNPIVDLRALKDRSFAVGVLLMSLVGFCLYASMVLLPQYLETLLNYPSMQAGLALSPRGLGSFALTFIVGAIAARVDVRRLLVTGFLVGATTMFMLARLNLNAGYWDIFWPQVMQGGAMACMFIPLSAAAMSHVPREKMGNATSIFNLMRNIGGSVGIAIMTTLLARRQQFHQSRLDRAHPPRPAPGLGHAASVHPVLRSPRLRPGHRLAPAYGAMLGQLQQHAAMLSFVEAFKIMGLVFLVMIPLVALLKDPKKHGSSKARQRDRKPTRKKLTPELLHA